MMTIPFRFWISRSQQVRMKGKSLEQLENYRDRNGMLVVFSTYQSLDVISKAQKKLLRKTRLLACSTGLYAMKRTETTRRRLPGTNRRNL